MQDNTKENVIYKKLNQNEISKITRTLNQIQGIVDCQVNANV